MKIKDKATFIEDVMSYRRDPHFISGESEEYQEQIRNAANTISEDTIANRTIIGYSAHRQSRINFMNKVINDETDFTEEVVPREGKRLRFTKNKIIIN